MAQAGPEACMDADTRAFYCAAMRTLQDAGIPCLVGGAYALMVHAGIERHTKDFDLFVRPEDAERSLLALRAHGNRVEITFPHWLGKVFRGDDFVDVIWSSGNGVARVDDAWFAHARRADVLGCSVGICAPEEMIWSKGFVQERERFDGADAMHLLRAQADTLDWPRLLGRFAEHWRVLYSHLILFGFVYPGERHRIPTWVTTELARRTEQELGAAGDARVCNGPLISREQYLIDIEHWGYADVRIAERTMTEDDVTNWTAAIGTIE